MADSGQSPAADRALALQPLERGAHDLAEQPDAQQPRGGRPVIGLELRVQQQKIDALDPQALQAGAQALGDLAFQCLRLVVRQLHLRGDQHAVGHRAAERLADDQLGLPGTVRGRDVDHRDAGVESGADGRDRLRPLDRPPHVADAAAAQGQRAHAAQVAE
jgi:hypothetical protein